MIVLKSILLIHIFQLLLYGYRPKGLLYNLKVQLLNSSMPIPCLKAECLFLFNVRVKIIVLNSLTELANQKPNYLPLFLSWQSLLISLLCHEFENFSFDLH